MILLLHSGGVHQILGSLHAGMHVSQLELGVLELGDALAELNALLGVLDVEDTYAADVFSHQLSNPGAVFASSLVEDGYLGIPDVNYVWGGYPTSRQAGLFSAGALVTSPKEEVAARAVYFMEKLPSVLSSAAQIEPSEVQDAVRKITDSNIYVNETAAGLLSTLRFWWTCTDAEYYYSYSDRISRVTPDDLNSFFRHILIKTCN